MTIPMLQPKPVWWECPSCHHRKLWKPPQLTAKPYHPCPKLNGLSAPYVRVDDPIEGIKTRVRHVPVERGDWVGKAVGVRHDNTGRAIMSVRTERADGSNDCVVYAPTAVAKAGEDF